MTPVPGLLSRGAGTPALPSHRQPSRATTSPASDSLSPERALPCLPGHTLASELDDGLFFLALRVLPTN